MIKRILVEVPNDYKSNHIYYYEEGAIHSKYIDSKSGCILVGRKNLEEVLDIIADGLIVTTDEDEIDKRLMMMELIDA